MAAYASYDAALRDQITSVFQRMAATRYTKIEGVVGARMDALAESDYATDRRNNVIRSVAMKRRWSSSSASQRPARSGRATECVGCHPRGSTHLMYRIGENPRRGWCGCGLP